MSLHIRILQFLFPDGAGSAMSRQDHGLIGQREQFLADGSDQILLGTQGEVCSTDGAGEQGISGEDQMLLGKIVTASSDGMTGSGKDLKGKAS